MNEQQTAKRLIKKHRTNCPFELADFLNIAVVYEPLGTINGYYTTAYGQKQIHINDKLPDYRQRFTMAHELGHALLHPKANTPFLREKTLFSVDKMEREANCFAVNLLVMDEDLENYKDYTITQLSCIFGIHERLLRIRLNNV